MKVGPNGDFIAAGLKREGWSTAEPVRRIFRQAFERAGLPYFKPHSIRDTLVQLGEMTCKTPEEFKTIIARDVKLWSSIAKEANISED